MKHLSIAENQAAQHRHLIQQVEQLEDATALNVWSDEFNTWLKDMQTEHQAMPTNEALIQLLEQIDLPETLFDEVEKLKTRLAGDMTISSLSRSMADMIDLIARARTRVRKKKTRSRPFLLTGPVA